MAINNEVNGKIMGSTSDDSLCRGLVIAAR